MLLCLLVSSYHHLVALLSFAPDLCGPHFLSEPELSLLHSTRMGSPTEVWRTNGNGSSEELARIAIDRGGTFTDAICSRAGKEDIVVKVRETW